ETGGRHRYLQSRLALPLVGRRERLAPHVRIGIQNAKRYAKVLELRYLLLKSVAQWLAEPFEESKQGIARLGAIFVRVPLERAWVEREGYLLLGAAVLCRVANR